MDEGHVLYKGQQLNLNDKLISPNGENKLYLQGDGNLVLRDKDAKAIWSTGTHGKGATHCILQSDGNLVIYSASGALWASGTHGTGVDRLTIKDYGVIKLETADGADVWIRPEGQTPTPTVEPTPVPTVEPTPVPTVEPTPVPQGDNDVL